MFCTGLIWKSVENKMRLVYSCISLDSILFLCAHHSIHSFISKNTYGGLFGWWQSARPYGTEAVSMPPCCLLVHSFNYHLGVWLPGIMLVDRSVIENYNKNYNKVHGDHISPSPL